MSEAAHAVAQSLAADVLASLQMGPDLASPPGEAWHGLALGEGVLPSARPLALDLPPFDALAAAAPAGAARVSEQVDASVSSELERLEELLAEQAHALREQRDEVVRLRALARDAAQRFEALDADSADVDAAHVERDHAVARALDAEASRAELAFQLDEVRGHLLALGAAEGALPGESIHATCARLAGTVRGLLSARAEAEERRDIGWARALLLEQDIEDLRIAARERERELAESKEHEELAHSEAHALHTQLAQANDRIAELEQQLARESEKRSEAAAKLAQGEADRLVGGSEVTRLQSEVEVQRAQLALVQSELDERQIQLEQARAIQRSELDRLSEARAAVERLAAERGRALTASNGALQEVRSLLEDLDRGLDRSMRMQPRTELTEPGLPVPGED